MEGYTILLNDDWDLTLNAAGGLAVTTEEYAIAQSVANSVRLFTHDAYFELTRGIPHYNIELGMDEIPSIAILTSRIKTVARQVPGVRDATVTLNLENDRILGGEILITTTNNIPLSVEI